MEIYSFKKYSEFESSSQVKLQSQSPNRTLSGATTETRDTASCNSSSGSVSSTVSRSLFLWVEHQVKFVVGWIWGPRCMTKTYFKHQTQMQLWLPGCLNSSKVLSSPWNSCQGTHRVESTLLKLLFSLFFSFFAQCIFKIA